MANYKRNFISEALIRVDFAVPIDELRNNLNHNLSKTILEDFKILDHERITGDNITFDGKTISTQTITDINWRGYGIDREKSIILNYNSLLISYKFYDGFDRMRDEFIKVLSKIFEIYNDTQIRRVGIRYINQIEILEKNPTNWESYINEGLISCISFSNLNKSISRAMSNMEYNFENYKLRFQYGIFNPDYPAKVKRKQFILDYDCYNDGLYENTNVITTFLDESHEKIKELFEESITDGLRDEMNLDE